ncbi:MAG: hypothetical protein IJU65_06450 [Desulfovibrio sp.]|nr:hypothetical protein [Desulfovibrio sp.]
MQAHPTALSLPCVTANPITRRWQGELRAEDGNLPLDLAPILPDVAITFEARLL